MTPHQKKKLEEQNDARRLAGLSLIKHRVIACMACGVRFESAGHKTCPSCDSRRRERSGMTSSSLTME